MKKYIFSLSLIFTFFVYAIFQRKTAADVFLLPAAPDVNQTSTIPYTDQPPRGVDQPVASPSTVPSSPTPAPKPAAPKGLYKDGTYTGPVADAYYGLVQVRVTVSGNRIIAVQFLQYPADRQNSIRINIQAMPYLQQEAIAAQSANVNIISGATLTSQAFIQSLASALAGAKL